MPHAAVGVGDGPVLTEPTLPTGSHSHRERPKCPAPAGARAEETAGQGGASRWGGEESLATRQSWGPLPQGHGHAKALRQAAPATEQWEDVGPEHRLGQWGTVRGPQVTGRNSGSFLHSLLSRWEAEAEGFQ